jgi:hypothetical protein
MAGAMDGSQEVKIVDMVGSLAEQVGRPAKDVKVRASGCLFLSLRHLRVCRAPCGWFWRC